MNMQIEITGKCFLRCKYCYNSNFNEDTLIKNELSTEEIIKIIKDAKEMGFNLFTLSGGEPFLKNGLQDIIDECKDVILHIFTSACNRKWAEMVISNPKIKALRVSLDGLSSNDKVRLGSNWQTVIKNLDIIRTKSKTKIFINTMLTKYNLNEINQFYNTLRKIGIDWWSIDFPIYIGRAQNERYNLYDMSLNDIGYVLSKLITDYLVDRPSFRLSIKGMYDSLVKVDNKNITKIQNDSLYRFDMHPCHYEQVIVIRPNGNITKCPSHNEVLANTRNFKSLNDALIFSRKQPFYNIKIKDFKECINCRYLGLCGAGCRANARYLTGSDYNKDPLACILFTIADEFIWHKLPDKQKKVYHSLLNTLGQYPIVPNNILEVF